MGKTLGLPQLPDERHAHDARSGLDRDADLESGIAGELHVLFPLGIAGKPRLTVTRVAERGRTSFGRASHGESLDQFAVETDVELLRPAHAFQVVLILTLQSDLDEVLTIDGEGVRDRDAATGSKRKVFALSILLDHVDGDLEGLDPRTRRRQPHREPADLTSD